MFAEGGSPQPTLSWRPPTGVGTGGTAVCDNNTCQLQFMQVLGQVLPTFGLNLCELSLYWDSHNSLKITLGSRLACSAEDKGLKYSPEWNWTELKQIEIR